MRNKIFNNVYMEKLLQYIVSAIVMLALDAIYLGTTQGIFADMVVSIQRVVMKLKLFPAMLCYIFLIFGLNYFILDQNRSVFDAFLFGLVIYGVFDSTNMAIFKKYNWNVAIMDTIWGGTLMALTTSAVYAMR